jgi:small subunit ribosomal protein S8
MRKLPDLIARLKVGYQKGASSMCLPYNKTWVLLLRLLYQEGYIQNYKVIENTKIYVFFRYYQGKACARTIKNLYKPSKPIYLSYNDLWKFSRNSGILFVSTSAGILSHETCLKHKLGGRILFYIS